MNKLEIGSRTGLTKDFYYGRVLEQVSKRRYNVQVFDALKCESKTSKMSVKDWKRYWTEDNTYSMEDSILIKSLYRNLKELRYQLQHLEDSARIEPEIELLEKQLESLLNYEQKRSITTIVCIKNCKTN